MTDEEGYDEDAPTGQRPYRDVENFADLERGSSPAFGSEADDDSDDGEQGLQLATEMTSSMRVTQPKGTRRNTITPIRPSLVGALEFRSVLSSLQKSRGSYSRPIHLRRYSDDPNGPANQHDGASLRSGPSSDYASSVIVTPAPVQDTDRPPDLRSEGSSKLRSVSMNDVPTKKIADPAAFSVAHVPDIGIVAATPTFPRELETTYPRSFSSSQSAGIPSPTSPSFSISPPPSSYGSKEQSPTRQRHEDRLAPPEAGFPGARHLRVDLKVPNLTKDSQSEPPRSRAQQSLRLEIPSARDGSSRPRSPSPILPFPAYTDSPIPMSAHGSRPPRELIPEATTNAGSFSDPESEYEERPIKWWPYRFLPSPYTLASTLFPTLCTWRNKTVWDKFVSVISAPSIFLLAITLPVVESETRDDEEPVVEEPGRRSSVSRPSRTRSGTAPLLVPDSPLDPETEPEWLRYRRSVVDHDRSRSPEPRGFSGHSTAAVAVAAEASTHHPHSLPMPTKPSPIESIPSGLGATSPQDWNRWLVSLQVFTAPFFVVLIIWANTDEGDTRLLIRLILYSLLFSIILYAVLVMTTSPNKPPKYRFLLCFLGFVVSISWISTIANEVVGVLKAFGVILGISDAILGLTIFAVGNSLGDLVADITVARLGYPVMALSACFGGPMLNILLGIGVSGLYMTLKDSSKNHLKHPQKKIKYRPYQIEVSGTLMISGITLLVTLVGLLVVVPLNKWVMSRKIGWGLIILWSISTVINLAFELSGALGNTF